MPIAALLLVSGLLALLVIVATTFWLSQRARLYSVEVSEIRDLRVSAVDLRNALLTAESSQRGYLYSANEIYLAPFDSARATAQRKVEELKNDVSRYPELSALVGRLSDVANDKIAEMDQTIQLKQAGQAQSAINVFLTNRGKSMMDKANVFVIGLIEAADAKLIEGVREQVRNADLLRWTSIAGGIIIILVVAGAVNLFARNAREIAAAHDGIRVVNESLEQRVDERTAALKAALQRAELLLAEVNHRVANSLSMVGSLVRLQIRTTEVSSAKDALNETVSRIAAIAAVHKRLYESGDVGLVALDEYLAALLTGLADTLRADGLGGSLTWTLEHAKLNTDASVNVGIMVTELVTNAYKYAYPEGRGDIRVQLRHLSNARVEIVVEDDGVGRGSGVVKGSGLGTRIITSMAANIGSRVEYLDRNPGTVARLTVPVAA